MELLVLDNQITARHDSGCTGALGKPVYTRPHAESVKNSKAKLGKCKVCWEHRPDRARLEIPATKHLLKEEFLGSKGENTSSLSLWATAITYSSPPHLNHLTNP